MHDIDITIIAWKSGEGSSAAELSWDRIWQEKNPLGWQAISDSMLVFGAVNVSVSINYSTTQLEILWTILFKIKKDKIMQDLISCHIDKAKGCVRIIRSPAPHHDTATSAPSSIPKVCCVASASSCCGTWGWKLSGSPWGKVSASSLSSSSCLAENPSTSSLNGVFSSFIILSFELFFSDGTWFGSFLCIFRGTSPIFWTETSTCTMFKPSKDLLVWFCPSSKMPGKPTQNHSDAAIWTTPPASSHHPVRLRVHSYCGHRAHHSGLHFPPPVALEMQPSEHHPSNLWRYSISPFGVIIKLCKWSNRSVGQTGSSKALHQNPRCCSSHSNWICSFCFQVSHPWCVASTCLRTVATLLQGGEHRWNRFQPFDWMSCWHP